MTDRLFTLLLASLEARTGLQLPAAYPQIPCISITCDSVHSICVASRALEDYSKASWPGRTRSIDRRFGRGGDSGTASIVKVQFSDLY